MIIKQQFDDQEDDEKKEAYGDELIFVFGFKRNKRELFTRSQIYFIYSVLLAFLFGSLVLIYFKIFAELSAVVLVGILIAMFVLYIYNSISIEYRYDLQKCYKNDLKAMYDVVQTHKLSVDLEISTDEIMRLQRDKNVIKSQAKMETRLDNEVFLNPSNFDRVLGSDFREKWKNRLDAKTKRFSEMEENELRAIQSKLEDETIDLDKPDDVDRRSKRRFMDKFFNRG